MSKAKDKASLIEMASKFVKLDKFKGVDFRRWQKKIHFMLTTPKVVYILSTPYPPVPHVCLIDSLISVRNISL